MAHVPTVATTELALLTFREALEAANTPSQEYDIQKWLYAPNFYSEYRYLLGTRGKNPLICIGINPSTAKPDVEHEKAVVSVAQGNPLHGFEGIVQGVGPGGGRVDANADQGIVSSCAQQIPVFRVKVGGIQPFFNVIVRRGGVGGFQSLPEGKKFQFRGGNGGNVGH